MFRGISFPGFAARILTVRRAGIQLCAAAAVLFAAAAPATAPCRAAELVPGGTATVRAVVDGDTVIIEPALDGASEIRLVGIQAPKLPLGRPNFPEWPLAADAKNVLEQFTLGREVELFYGGRRKDRHGRLLAHLHAGPTWVQGALLRTGYARVYSFADNRALVAEMLALERHAREQRRGIWRDSFYDVRTPESVAVALDSFQLVQGLVADVAVVRGRAYLNFGANWRTDFTVTLAPAVVRLFAGEGVDLASYAGAVVRVRGWVKEFNGPMIETTHPEQIERVTR
jgi:endonuclease YncB( thermonuclease family)